MKTAEVSRYCGGYVRRGNSRELYSKGNQEILICTNCNAYVMCHKNTGLPMGRLANVVLRLKRREAHEIFDAFWRERDWTRDDAYRWLAKAMHLSDNDAHIANFEMDECEQVIRLCRDFEESEAA